MLLLLLRVGCCVACETALTREKITAAGGERVVEFFGGSATSAAGDVNGDGFDDFAVGVHTEGLDLEGVVFLVFGRSAAAWASAQFNFSETETPDAASWVRIRGASNSYLGRYGVTHGDFNGDGFDDLLLGAYAGRAFVVYGHSGAWRSFGVAEIESSEVPGFAVVGSSGTSMQVGNAGDLNGDGVEDMLVSVLNVGNPLPFVIFGKPGSTRSSFDLNNVDGINGFSLIDGSDSLGYCMTQGHAGDVNGDGLSDLVTCSCGYGDNVGRAYILFARNVSATGQQWPASFNLTSDVDGTNGFAIEGSAHLKASLGWTSAGAGDVNGDGFADIFVGSLYEGGWIVFGHPAPWEPVLNVSLINGANGFHFATTVSNEFWGYSGGGAGDFNGDGFDDILIGGNNALNSSGTATGAAAIIFGRPGPWPAEIGRDDVVGSAGFLVDGPSAGSRFGYSSRGAGDVNGDGLDDFVVGARIYNAQQGYALLVFGVNDHCAVCSNTTDECLVCTDSFILNGTFCEALPDSSSAQQTGCSSSITGFSSSSSAHQQQGISVVVIIKFLEDVTDPTELQEEIASVLGIDAGLVSVVVISPTEVEVTIIGSEETAQRLVDIINNGGAGSDGSGLGLLRKAIDAHIRKDTDGSSDDDGVDAASHVALSHLVVAVFIVAVAALL